MKNKIPLLVCLFAFLAAPVGAEETTVKAAEKSEEKPAKTIEPMLFESAGNEGCRFLIQDCMHQSGSQNMRQMAGARHDKVMFCR